MSWALCEELVAVQMWPRDDDDSHSTVDSLSKGGPPKTLLVSNLKDQRKTVPARHRLRDSDYTDEEDVWMVCKQTSDKQSRPETDEQDPHSIQTDPDSPYSDTEECVPLPSDFLLSLPVMTNDAHETLDDSIPRAPNQPTGPGPSSVPEGSKILSPTEKPGEPPPSDKPWFSGSSQCHSVEYTLPRIREKAPNADVGSDPPTSLSGNVLKEWFRGAPQDFTRPQPTATEHPHNCRCWRC